MNDIRRLTSISIFTLLFLLASSLAFAVTAPSAPAISANGSFVVTYNGSGAWL